MHHPRLEEKVLKDQTSQKYFFNLAKCHHKSDKYVFCTFVFPFQNNRLEQS